MNEKAVEKTFEIVEVLVDAAKKIFTSLTKE